MWTVHFEIYATLYDIMKSSTSQGSFHKWHGLVGSTLQRVESFLVVNWKQYFQYVPVLVLVLFSESLNVLMNCSDCSDQEYILKLFLCSAKHLR